MGVHYMARFCDQCGEEISKEDLFCPNCGNSMGDSVDNTKKPDETALTNNTSSKISEFVSDLRLNKIKNNDFNTNNTHSHEKEENKSNPISFLISSHKKMTAWSEKQKEKNEIAERKKELYLRGNKEEIMEDIYNRGFFSARTPYTTSGVRLGMAGNNLFGGFGGASSSIGEGRTKWRGTRVYLKKLV